MQGNGGKNNGVYNLALGGFTQCAEAATLGLPLEVWKTRMGRFRNESTGRAFLNVYKNGGVKAFWKGLGPKMGESASKGAVLMYTKEISQTALLGAGLGATTSGMIAGAFAGCCQTVVIAPATFLVTAGVTGDQSVSTLDRARAVFRSKGLAGFYPGGTAIAFRQATNWASRQGFTEAVRVQFQLYFHGKEGAKLTKGQEIGAGIVGGALSCINHPFEVARIEAQARAEAGQASMSMVGVMRHVVQEQGIPGLFKGIVPRIGLGIWQTLFMVTGAKLIKEHLSDSDQVTSKAREIQRRATQIQPPAVAYQIDPTQSLQIDTSHSPRLLPVSLHGTTFKPDSLLAIFT